MPPLGRLSLLSAGSNAQGQLGNTTIDDSHDFQACSFTNLPRGTLPPGTSDILNVANGANHTLVLLEVKMADGAKFKEVWGCGDGRKGQLGPEHRQEPTTVFQKLAHERAFDELGYRGYTVKSVEATWEASYLVVTKPDSHDVIVSFGSNEFGDLGIGRDGEDEALEKGPSMHVVDFSHVSVTGNPIQSAEAVTIEMVRTGQRHIIASLKVAWADKEPVQILIGWGACRHGQLGDMSTPNQSTSRSRVSGRPQKTKKLPVPSQPTYCSRPKIVWTFESQPDFIVDYSLGFHHSVFLHASGRVSVRGSDRKRQIQGLVDLQNVRDIKCTWNGTCALVIDTPPRIVSTGNNSHDQLGRPDNLPISEFGGLSLKDVTIKTLACGSEHSLVCITINGKDDEVWGWGWNEHGNLGIGTTTDAPTPQKIWPPSGVLGTPGVCTVHNIWGGNGSSWILCEMPDEKAGTSP